MNKLSSPRKNFFATRYGILAVGGVIGILAALLQKFGNPGNMGICVACFERDIAGALGLHKAAIVQYMRPEIMGLGLGAFIAAQLAGDFKSRGGSAPLVRFVLGMVAAVGALVFLGCPWRALLRLAGGDGNAILGLLGLAAGIYIATLFFRKGYNLGRSTAKSSFWAYIYPLVSVAFLALLFIYPQVAGENNNGPLWYSLKGPGSMHAPILISLGFALLIGFLAQRSRFCTMGALRDLFLFRQPHLFYGILGLTITAFITNLILGQFHWGFEGQPIAHTDGLWNFLGMALAGLAFAFAGGCPGRQIFLGGEGDLDAALFVAGVLCGAAVAHNFGTASSGAGVGPNGPVAVLIGTLICFAIGGYYTFIKKA